MEKNPVLTNVLAFCILSYKITSLSTIYPDFCHFVALGPGLTFAPSASLRH